MWVSKDVPLFAAYNKMSGVVASLQPNAADWSQKEAALDGFPIYQETTITIGPSSSQTREELVTAETKEFPPGTFDVPAGFRAVPFDPFPSPQ
jgi:hypothetical protein